jgi:meiotically up-regulated gene 157 (Mug157) protein
MSQTMYALTSNSPAEIALSLSTLKASAAGTGFMHESYFKDDATRFTRPWFAWANTLFGELIVTLAAKHPELLQ